MVATGMLYLVAICLWLMRYASSRTAMTVALEYDLDLLTGPFDRCLTFSTTFPLYQYFKIVGEVQRLFLRVN